MLPQNKNNGNKHLSEAISTEIASRKCAATKVTAFIAMAAIIASVIIPTPVNADGGPMVDPLLFAQLQEGQQVAVMTPG